MDPATQLLHTTSYSAGAWNNGLPALNVGQAAFFVLIPEPSTFFSLAVAVVLAFGSSHRKPYEWGSSRSICGISATRRKRRA
jgi:hypothetical protein